MKDIFSYFNYDSSAKILDVFKTIDFSTVINSDDYTLYTPIDTDNLMSISYKFYNRVDDWWIIYFFNKMVDISFSIYTNTSVNLIIKYYSDLLLTYDSNTLQQNNELKETIILYYLEENNDVKLAIQKALTLLNDPISRTDTVFLSNYKDFIHTYIITNTTVMNPIKIPNTTLVFKIKNALKSQSVAWNF